MSFSKIIVYSAKSDLNVTNRFHDAPISSNTVYSIVNSVLMESAG